MSSLASTLRGRAKEPSITPEARSFRYIAVAAAAVLLVLVLPLLAGSNEPIWPYYKDVAASTAIFVIAAVFLTRVPAVGGVAYRLATRYHVGLLAVLSLVVTALFSVFVFDRVPHVSDEVAYQFQARALATGRLALQVPAGADFFGFIHLVTSERGWYGIMNPGWPALLAIGEVLHAPWLINPVLGALAILVFHAFFKRAGYTSNESRLAILLLAVSPFVLFMSASLMAHTANLLLFGVMLWAWTFIIGERSLPAAALAGAALGFNMLVRPIDTAVVALPFIAQLCYRALRDRRLLPHVLMVGVIGATGVALSLLYNEALTGDARVMPMTKYFLDRNPGEKFGMGFGADMGTTVHGPEWPGYYPADAVRVTSYRLAELLRDVHYLPVLLAAALLLPLAFREFRRGEWHRLLLLSGLALVGMYFFHFYHGIAYGSRHYFLALPAIAVALARPLCHWLESMNDRVALRARAALAAVLLFALSYPYVRLLPVYDGNYRGASAIVRDAVAERGIRNAVVFVEEGNWAWKSAFPLNEYPLDNNSVIFAKSLGRRNAELVARYPTRSFYTLRVRQRGVQIEPLKTPER